MPYAKLSRLLLIDEESATKVPDIKNLEKMTPQDERPRASYSSRLEGFPGHVDLDGDWEDYSHIAEGQNKRKRVDTDDLCLTSPMSVDAEVRYVYI